MAADLASRLGVSLRMVAVLSSNRAEFLRGSKVDLVIATLSITEGRRREYGIIDPPYYAAGAAVLVRRGMRIDETAQLEGRTVCAIEGNIFLIDLKAQAPLVRLLLFKEVPSAEQARWQHFRKCRGSALRFRAATVRYRGGQPPIV